MVEGVKRFIRDSDALLRLGSSPTPPVRLGIRYWMGVWGRDMDITSSSLKELATLVDALEAEGAQENFEETEFFFFGDNSTAESAYYCGTFSRKLCLDQVLQPHEL
eukprot:881467-Ditylum_brightwellii.AAC.1